MREASEQLRTIAADARKSVWICQHPGCSTLFPISQQQCPSCYKYIDITEFLQLHPNSPVKTQRYEQRLNTYAAHQENMNVVTTDDDPPTWERILDNDPCGFIQRPATPDYRIFDYQDLMQKEVTKAIARGYHSLQHRFLTDHEWRIE